MSHYQGRQLAASHDAFQRRCEENTAWYLAQLHGELPAITRPIRVPASSSANEPLTVFHSKVLPQLTLFELGCALGRASKCGEEALLVALVLMSRYCASTRTKPTAHMMHRLYVACLQIGMKAHSDVYYRNDAFARLAGITFLELNRLENEVIRGLHWSVQVAKEEIDAMVFTPEKAILHAPAARTFEALATLRQDSPTCASLNASCLSPYVARDPHSSPAVTESPSVSFLPSNAASEDTPASPYIEAGDRNGGFVSMNCSITSMPGSRE